MHILPSVRASMHERFIFNFRLPADALRSYLPVSWLSPHEIEGAAVASFCLLDLRNITVSPLPTVAGLRSVSCAPRYAVLDREGSPAVFVPARYTNSRFGAWFTGLGCSASHPFATARIDKSEDAVRIGITLPDGTDLLTATVRRSERFVSDTFRSMGEFKRFIAEGVTSYGLSRYENRLTIMDLHKSDTEYEVYEPDDIGGLLVDRWRAAGGVLDSVFRTSRGRYEWIYYGLTREDIAA